MFPPSLSLSLSRERNGRIKHEKIRREESNEETRRMREEREERKRRKNGRKDDVVE